MKLTKNSWNIEFFSYFSTNIHINNLNVQCSLKQDIHRFKQTKQHYSVLYIYQYKRNYICSNHEIWLKVFHYITLVKTRAMTPQCLPMYFLQQLLYFSKKTFKIALSCFVAFSLMSFFNSNFSFAEITRSQIWVDRCE